MIDWQPVTSTSISHLGHDGTDLFVRFKNGGEYSFANVPRQHFEDLLAAKSVGAHFATHVRGKFPFTRREKAEATR
jgi:hypothetical protein